MMCHGRKVKMRDNEMSQIRQSLIPTGTEVSAGDGERRRCKTPEVMAIRWCRCWLHEGTKGKGGFR